MHYGIRLWRLVRNVWTRAKGVVEAPLSYFLAPILKFMDLSGKQINEQHPFNGFPAYYVPIITRERPDYYANLA